MQIKAVFQRYSLFIVASLLLSGLAFYHQQPINPDGRLYLWGAQAFLSHGLAHDFFGGWQAALVIYPWPFYSLCIALVANVSGLSVLHAGLLLTTIFMAIIVCLLMRLTAQLKPQYSVATLFGLIFLANHYFNHFRTDVMRGYGYLVFGLFAFLCFIKFLRHRRLLDAVCWMVSIALATAFRVEGIVIAYFAPFIIFVLPGKRFIHRAVDFCKAYSLQILVLISIVVWKHYAANQDVSQLGRLNEILLRAHGVMTDLFPKTIAHYKQVLHVLLEDNGAHLLAALLVLIVFIGKMVRAFLIVLSLPGAILAYLGVRYGRYQWDQATKAGFFSFLTVILLTLMIHLAREWFVSTRFVLLPAVLILLFAPLGLQAMRRAYYQKNRPWYGRPCVIALMGLGLLYHLVAGIGHFGPSKTYLIDAGQWTAQHVPKTAAIVTNDPQFEWYAARYKTTTLINDKRLMQSYLAGKANRFNVIALRLSAKQQHHFTLNKQSPYKRCIKFHNARGDGLVVFSRLSFPVC